MCYYSKDKDYYRGYGLGDSLKDSSMNETECKCFTGTDYPLCLRGYCRDINSNITTCVNKPSDTAYKYFDNNLGVCVINADFENNCQNLQGVWIHGRKWIDVTPKPFNKNLCDNLKLCLINNQVVEGDICDTATNCVGNCPSCTSNNANGKKKNFIYFILFYLFKFNFIYFILFLFFNSFFS